MKTKSKSYLIILTQCLFLFNNAFSQNYENISNWRKPGYDGLNVYETPKDSALKFNGVRILLGGDFTLQFQSISHSTSSSDTLATLGSNFNLPTANLNINAQLAEGVRVNLTSYLSSRHHNETWVKGGYMQIDKLDFIREDFLKGLMNILTIRAGMDEINYGDAHFRRSDNARALYNPFVGNYIMDAFSTEVFSELTLQKSGFLFVSGISNGKLNQSVIKDEKENKPSLYGKLGYDKSCNDELRIRNTGSIYLSPGYDNGQYLYSGDRAGSRYYSVLQEKGAVDNFRSGRFSPGFIRYYSLQYNPFIQYKGFEFFGILEYVIGDQSELNTNGAYYQIGTELIYRFGKRKNFYLGGRYNSVSGKDYSQAMIKSIERINFGGGWFMTKNVLLKAEYVNQNYWGNGWTDTIYEGGNFNGAVLEAVIGF